MHCTMIASHSTWLLQAVCLWSCIQLSYCQQSTSAGVYGGSQPNSCGYGMLASTAVPNGHLGTLISSSPLNSGLAQGGCGACVQVTCTDATPGACPSPSPVTVQIVDQSSSGLQLSSADMASLSPQGNRLGHVAASIQQVSCAATGSIIVRLMQLAPVANGYAKLALLNVAGTGAVSTVALAPTGTQNWAQLKNNYGAVWEGSCPSVPPLDIQLISGGQTLVLTGIILASSMPGDLPSSVQFSSSALPAAGAESAGSASPVSPAAPAAPPPAALPNDTSAPGASPNISTSPAASPNISAPPSPSPTPVGASPVASPAPAEASPAASPSPSAASAEPLPATTPTGALFNLAAAANQATCQTINQVLNASPDLTTWVRLIQSQGLQNNLNGRNQGITMFAPINDAFSEPLLAAIPGLDGAQSLSDLAGQIPNIVSNFLGYSVIPQVLSQNQLANGAMFNTTSRLKQGNSVNGVPTLQALSFRTSGGMTQVVGLGSVATILQPNIQACGSVIHLVSNVLLPFNVRAFNLPSSSPGSSPPGSPSPAVAMSG